MLQGTPAFGDDADETREQRRPKTQDVVSTPVVEADTPAASLRHLKGYGSPLRPKATWPRPGSATVLLPDVSAKSAKRQAGSLPVRIGRPMSSTGSARSAQAAVPARAKVDVLGHAAALKPSKRVGAEDIQIFGTADAMGIPIFTADAKFVRAAGIQGVSFNAIVHAPASWIGK
nr:DUF1308 domain-containing protein [Streptomyces sp. SID12501]